MRLFDDVASRIDDPHLRRAFELALHGAGRTAPNPAVGCVIVAGGDVVGEGYHPAAGEPHAEVFALRAAGAAARGATVYVTLEPCNHFGRTPPCAEALIEAGVARVVIGMADPTAQAGGGARALRDAGVEVAFAADASPYQRMNEGWIKRVASGLPFTTAKVGLSLDSRVALRTGARSNMTGPHGSTVTSMLRQQADAVVVGASTVAIDDPELTARDASSGALVASQPVRVILVGSQPPPSGSQVFTDGKAPTMVLAAGGVPIDEWVTQLPPQVRVARYDGTQGVVGALRALGERGINEVLVEPGPRLLASLWREPGMLDALVTVTAGGMAGREGVGLYDADGDITNHSLLHRFAAAEAGIVGDVSVTLWRKK